jgi:ssDNA-binding Zn-finger/Zn-ribbon topoisomerase 1
VNEYLGLDYTVKGLKKMTNECKHVWVKDSEDMTWDEPILLREFLICQECGQMKITFQSADKPFALLFGNEPIIEGSEGILENLKRMEVECVRCKNMMIPIGIARESDYKMYGIFKCLECEHEEKVEVSND